MKSNTLVQPGKLRHLFFENTPLVATTPEIVERFASVEEMVEKLKPVEPVHCIRPHTAMRATEWFVNAFPGEVMYSVKSNPDPLVLNYLSQAGVKHFDIASLTEIKQVRAQFPHAPLHFMHPVKSREAIEAAYFDFGVRNFSLDSQQELDKILEVTGHATDLGLFVRLAMPNEAAAYALTGKFGIAFDEAGALLKSCRAVAAKLGLCFHVGSQCMEPLAYRTAMLKAKTLINEAGVKLDVLDIGGGFPSIYPGMIPPALPSYMDAIKQAWVDVALKDCELVCEPGRALVAEAGSLVVRVELRKDNMLYINDGTYGSLFDAGTPGFSFPVKAIRPYRDFAGDLMPFSLFGPTCDSMDAMKGPFMLPSDIREGDWIEFGQMGAYGATLRTQFNGFYSDKKVEVGDEPLLSMFARE